MAKDALGHGSEGGWGAHPQTGQLKTASKYHSFRGRTDAVVRTERLPAGYLWQHGDQYGHANSVADAKATVESRVADEARYKAHEPVTVSAFDGPRERSGLGHGPFPSNADFIAKYGKPRDHAAEQRAFNSGKREINRLRRSGK
jgi:hypothetical protein